MCIIWHKAGKECHEHYNLKTGLGRTTICRASFRSLVESELRVSSISKQKNKKTNKFLPCLLKLCFYLCLTPLCDVLCALQYWLSPTDSTLSFHFILEATVDETELLALLINVSPRADVPEAFCKLAAAPIQYYFTRTTLIRIFTLIICRCFFFNKRECGHIFFIW